MPVVFPFPVISGRSAIRFGSITRTAAQTRVLDAAFNLIAQQGVSSLTERELGGLEPALEAAEAEKCAIRAREILLGKVIDLAVARHHMMSVLQFR